MIRRHFLATGLAGATASSGSLLARGGEDAPGQSASPLPAGLSPLETKLNVKPVMTNIIHSDSWEGSCRWKSIEPSEELRLAAEAFAGWSTRLREKGLGGSSEVQLLEPAHLTFDESFEIKPQEFAKLDKDAQQADAYYVVPSGSSISAFKIAERAHKPILMVGLGCRNVDIAAYTRAMGEEAFVAADEADLGRILTLLKARKVFRSTRVLFPTDKGLPAACSIGSIWNLKSMEERLGVAVRTISYAEMKQEVELVRGDSGAAERAAHAADDLLKRAAHSYIDRAYVVKSLLFYRAIQNLMARHQCNAFTIECFEFCSSRLPDDWEITPCLIHGLLKDMGCAASCEGDLGSLLAIRMLLSMSGKSCHQGNSDPKGEGTFRINHSNPALKMNGFDKPDLPFELGRFVSKGWGTKLSVDFMNNIEKTVTVARVDPTASKLLVLRGELVGASGFGQDLIGCSVEALIRPPKDRLDEFLRKRLDFGNHLQWVYGDYVEPLRQLGDLLKLQVDVVS